MREAIRSILQTLRNDFGSETSSVFTNPKRFKAALDDVEINEDEKKIRQILNVAVRDVQAYSRLSSAGQADSFVIVNLVTEMSTTYMIDETAARVVIECIAEMLGRGSLKRNDGDSDDNTPPAVITPPSSAKVLSDFGQEELKTGLEYYEQLDFDRALHHLRIAADRSNAEAECAVGDIYAHEQNLNHDIRQAMEWYEKAAEHGHSRAQWLAGVGYLEGTGCVKDLDKAKYWLQKSANQYDMDGQYALAGYYTAIGDFDSAIPWLKRAGVKGHKAACDVLIKMGLI